MKWVNSTILLTDETKSALTMKYHEIRHEFRCEKMIMFCILLHIKKGFK